MKDIPDLRVYDYSLHPNWPVLIYRCRRCGGLGICEQLVAGSAPALTSMQVCKLCDGHPRIYATPQPE